MESSNESISSSATVSAISELPRASTPQSTESYGKRISIPISQLIAKSSETAPSSVPEIEAKSTAAESKATGKKNLLEILQLGSTNSSLEQKPDSTVSAAKIENALPDSASTSTSANPSSTEVNASVTIDPQAAATLKEMRKRKKKIEKSDSNSSIVAPVAATPSTGTTPTLGLTTPAAQAPSSGNANSIDGLSGVSPHSVESSKPSGIIHDLKKHIDGIVAFEVQEKLNSKAILSQVYQ